MNEPDLPPPPATWRRALRLPRALARELEWSISRRLRSLRQRRWRRSIDLGPLRRAWMRTDPYHVQRVFHGLSGSLAEPGPPATAPTPGTQATLTGRLRTGALEWGELLLDDVAIDDAIASALDLEPRSADFPVEITVRVLDEPARPATDEPAPPDDAAGTA